MANGSEWLSVEQAAEWLGVPAHAVRGAVQSGGIPALVIGDYVRVSRDALLGRAAAPVAGRAVPVIPVAVTEARPQFAGGLPVPDGLAWVEELVEADEFTIRWPKTGGGGNEEVYPMAWRGVVLLNKVKMEAKVGQCIRHDKGRRTVLLDKNPVAEFVDTSDGRWASVIKPDGKKTLAVGVVPPPLYLNARIGSYRDATGLTGIGVPKGLAVILDDDDLRGHVHHAAARWLGRNRFP